METKTATPSMIERNFQKLLDKQTASLAEEIALGFPESMIAKRRAMIADTQSKVNQFKTRRELQVTTFDDTKCKRCGGTGYIPQFQHIDGGICYECGGAQ